MGAPGTTLHCCFQDSDDIRYMVGALKDLGVQLEEKWDEGVMIVHGCGGRFPSQVGQSGFVVVRCMSSHARRIYVVQLQQL